VELQPPYGVIADLSKEEAIVPFLGAGENFGMRKPHDAQWNEKTSTFLPSGAELSRFLADEFGVEFLAERLDTGGHRPSGFAERRRRG